MKKEFIGYYEPKEEEINNAWNNGVFAFDANTLLNLYRYSGGTRNDFLAALQKVKKRLFLPYQAAFEFHSNRVGVIEGVERSYNELEEIFKQNYEKSLRDEVNRFKRHPSLKIDALKKLHDEFVEEIVEELESQKAKHPNFKTDHTVLDKVTELFDKSVGDNIPKSELEKIYKEGKERYDNDIPPGYKDEKEKRKKGLRNVFGDLIVWRELISFSNKENQPLIFVTDDRKEDWWRIENGRTIRPREELIKEFFDETGIRILIYNADQFLKFAKERGLVPKIKDETIDEVKNIRIEDENKYSLLFNYEPKYYGGGNAMPFYSGNSKSIIHSSNEIQDLSRNLKTPKEIAELLKSYEKFRSNFPSKTKDSAQDSDEESSNN